MHEHHRDRHQASGSSILGAGRSCERLFIVTGKVTTGTPRTITRQPTPVANTIRATGNQGFRRCGNIMGDCGVVSDLEKVVTNRASSFRGTGITKSNYIRASN